MEEIKLILDENLLNEYTEYYFKEHPRAKKQPIEKPWHPSINQWMILPRVQMNSLKQKWKDFGVWWMEKLGYTDMMLDSFSVISTVYFNTSRRHDPDNYTIKFLADSLVAAGFLVDDDGKHMHSLTLKTDVDKEWPRTEIIIRKDDKE